MILKFEQQILSFKQENNKDLIEGIEGIEDVLRTSI